LYLPNGDSTRNDVLSLGLLPLIAQLGRFQRLLDVK
jgi:hypothetical protein